MDTKHNSYLGGHCAYEMNASTGAFEEDAVPQPNDITVCLKCGTPHKYTEKLEIVLLSVDEIEDIQINHPDSWEQLKILQKYITERNQQN